MFPSSFQGCDTAQKEFVGFKGLAWGAELDDSSVCFTFCINGLDSFRIRLLE